MTPTPIPRVFAPIVLCGVLGGCQPAQSVDAATSRDSADAREDSGTQDEETGSSPDDTGTTISDEDWSLPDDDCVECFHPQHAFVTFGVAYDFDTDSICSTYYPNGGATEGHSGIDVTFLSDTVDDFGDPVTCHIAVGWLGGEECATRDRALDTGYTFATELPVDTVLIDGCTGLVNATVWGNLPQNIADIWWGVGFGGPVPAGFPDDSYGLPLFGAGFFYRAENNTDTVDVTAAGYGVRLIDDPYPLTMPAPGQATRIEPPETDPLTVDGFFLLAWGESYGSTPDLYVNPGMFLPANIP